MADEHMVEQMSRSRGNRSGRRSFRGTTPPPSPKQDIIISNQKTSNTTDEKDNTAVVFEPVTENSLVVDEEKLSVPSENESIHNLSNDMENKETNISRKRPPSPNLPVPIATKKSLNDSGSDEVSVEDESKLKLFSNNKPSGYTVTTTTTGQLQHAQVSSVRTQAMPPMLGKLESSASKVLTEEFQKQLGQENSKLRLLIIKEVRRPGKSKFLFSLCVLSVVNACHELKHSNIAYTISHQITVDHMIHL